MYVSMCAFNIPRSVLLSAESTFPDNCNSFYCMSCNACSIEKKKSKSNLAETKGEFLLEQAVEGMHECSKASIACILLGTEGIPNPIVFSSKRTTTICCAAYEKMKCLRKKIICVQIESKKSEWLRSVVCLACINLPM